MPPKKECSPRHIDCFIVNTYITFIDVKIQDDCQQRARKVYFFYSYGILYNFYELEL